MRTPIIAGNWKMNTNVSEAVALARAMKDRLDAVKYVERVLCPPFVSLHSVGDVMAGTSIQLGAQNMYSEEKGAFTGEISPLMLKDLCHYVILGHSERRQYFAETDDIVNHKVKAALKAGLRAIVCVGEKLDENEAGRTVDVVAHQVRGALKGVMPAPHALVMAYEPIWAIGTGKAATGPGANATVAVIRHTLAELYGAGFAQEVRIQYGGSVTAANIAEFMSQSDIDGALVGGASLKANDFISIVEQSAQARKC